MSEDWTLKRKTLDGRKDTVEMLVPVRRRSGAVVVLRGDGVPTLLAIGASDLPSETWLDITNRSLRGNPYNSVQKVCLGMVALSDETEYHLEAGTTFGVGSADPDIQENAGIFVPAPDELVDERTAVWMVTDSQGKKSLLVFPAEMEVEDQKIGMARIMPSDSFWVRDTIAPFMKGEFSVDLVAGGGRFLAADDLSVPGWTTLIDTREDPGVLADPAP